MYSRSYGSFLRFLWGASEGKAGPRSSSSEEVSAPDQCHSYSAVVSIPSSAGFAAPLLLFVSSDSNCDLGGFVPCTASALSTAMFLVSEGRPANFCEVLGKRYFYFATADLHHLRRRLYIFLFLLSDTYGHSCRRTSDPVRSRIYKPVNARLVIAWVTSSESRVLYVSLFFFVLFGSIAHT